MSAQVGPCDSAEADRLVARRWLGPVGAMGLATAVAVVLQWPDFGRFSTFPVLMVCLGTVAFAGAGVLLWQEPAQRPNAILFAVTAVLFTCEWAFTWPHTPFPFIALAAGQPFAIVLGLILLRYPGTHLVRPTERVVVAVALVWTVTGRLAWALTTRPEWFASGIASGHGRLPASTWWPSVHADRHLSQAIATVVDYGQLLVVPAFLLIIGRRLAHQSRPVRIEMAPMMVGLVLLGGVIVTHLITVLALANNSAAAPHEWISAALSATVMLIPLAFIFSALQRRLARAAISDLLVKIAPPATISEIETALRHTLQDDHLTVRYWLPESQTFVDAHGFPASGSVDLMAMTAVPVADHAGDPLAVVYADAAHQRHPALLQSAVAASAIALENARLEAALRTQLQEVRASRSRIVEAGLLERRRMERDLHDGAQQQLLAISATLGRLEARGDMSPASRTLVGQLREQLRDTRVELRDLARGLHPSILSQAGLGPALEVVAERLPLAIDLQIPARRWPADIEITAYFIACEALTNIAKHAGTNRASISISSDQHHLHITITDPGSGGARLLDGGGLAGLRDRAQALGGELTLLSPPAGGTTVQAVLPCV